MMVIPIEHQCITWFTEAMASLISNSAEGERSWTDLLGVTLDNTYEAVDV
ncbi:hypothetical protein DAI22_08g116900 [Oryza sativa Japonica Group]|nr:hypothetical protein DAI22_08g116900 [Oryza sativa Japonica Group]